MLKLCQSIETKKGQQKIKTSVLVAEFAYNSLNTQFGLVMLLLIWMVRLVKISSAISGWVWQVILFLAPVSNGFLCV